MADDDKVEEGEEEFTPFERHMLEQHGMTEDAIRKAKELDRILPAFSAFAEVADMRDGRSLEEFLTGEMGMNEREVFSFVRLLSVSRLTISMGSSIVTLIALFRAGMEFAGKEPAEYTDEDHADWVAMQGASKNFVEDDVPSDMPPGVHFHDAG